MTKNEVKHGEILSNLACTTDIDMGVAGQIAIEICEATAVICMRQNVSLTTGQKLLNLAAAMGQLSIDVMIAEGVYDE